MISPIKVLVRDVPQLVRDVLAHAIVSEPDMELMPERSLPPPLADTAAPDVVITTATTHKAGIEDINRTLWHWPRTQVLLITLDGHDSVLFGQRIHSTRLGELSPRELVDAIRTVVRHHES